MKLLLEIVISALLHPLAYLLALINILGRSDLNGGQKLLWAIVCIVWGIGPILYVLIGGGGLWELDHTVASSTCVAPAIASRPAPSSASVARTPRTTSAARSAADTAPSRIAID